MVTKLLVQRLLSDIDKLEHSFNVGINQRCMLVIGPEAGKQQHWESAWDAHTNVTAYPVTAKQHHQ